VDENIYYDGEPLTSKTFHPEWTEKKKKKKKKD